MSILNYVFVNVYLNANELLPALFYRNRDGQYGLKNTGASQLIRMLWKSSFISVIQLKLWNLCIK